MLVKWVFEQLRTENWRYYRELVAQNHSKQCLLMHISLFPILKTHITTASGFFPSSDDCLWHLQFDALLISFPASCSSLQFAKFFIQQLIQPLLAVRWQLIAFLTSQNRNLSLEVVLQTMRKKPVTNRKLARNL